MVVGEKAADLVRQKRLWRNRTADYGFVTYAPSTHFLGQSFQLFGSAEVPATIVSIFPSAMLPLGRHLSSY